MNKHGLSTVASLSTFVLLLVSCAADSPVDFANRFIAAENKAWGSGDLADLKSLESENVVYHLPGMDMTGWKAHESYIVEGRKMVSDLKQNWKYLSGEGNHFVLSYESSGIMRIDPAQPAVSTSVNYLCVFRIEDGKIAEVWMNGSGTNTPVEDVKKG
jgi:ketosteroid isomerase-like protein